MEKNPKGLMAAYEGLSFLHADNEDISSLDTYTFEGLLSEKDVEKRLKMMPRGCHHVYRRDRRGRISRHEGHLGGMGGLQIREVQGGKGSGSQHSLLVEFGLGYYDGPVDVEVRFPSGKIVRLSGVGIDQKIVVEEN